MQGGCILMYPLGGYFCSSSWPPLLAKLNYLSDWKLSLQHVPYHNLAVS